MVVVIIGIIGAIAIPRIVRGSSSAGAAALESDLAALRNAIDRYWAEHDSTYPSTEKISEQLTQFSDSLGNPMKSRTDRYIFGPYLVQIPPLPVGLMKGNRGIAESPGPGIGWIYNPKTGQLRANTGMAEVDERAFRFDKY